jgi:hypothetical protein
MLLPSETKDTTREDYNSSPSNVGEAPVQDKDADRLRQAVLGMGMSPPTRRVKGGVALEEPLVQ